MHQCLSIVLYSYDTALVAASPDVEAEVPTYVHMQYRDRDKEERGSGSPGVISRVMAEIVQFVGSRAAV